MLQNGHDFQPASDGKLTSTCSKLLSAGDQSLLKRSGSSSSNRRTQRMHTEPDQVAARQHRGSVGSGSLFTLIRPKLSSSSRAGMSCASATASWPLPADANTAAAELSLGRRWGGVYGAFFTLRLLCMLNC